MLIYSCKVTKVTGKLCLWLCVSMSLSYVNIYYYIWWFVPNSRAMKIMNGMVTNGIRLRGPCTSYCCGMHLHHKKRPQWISHSYDIVLFLLNAWLCSNSLAFFFMCRSDIFKKTPFAIMWKFWEHMYMYMIGKSNPFSINIKYNDWLNGKLYNHVIRRYSELERFFRNDWLLIRKFNPRKHKTYNIACFVFYPESNRSSIQNDSFIVWWYRINLIKWWIKKQS